METKIKISNEAEICIIDIEGIIGVSEECQFSDDTQRVATYERFRKEVERIRQIEAKEVVVNIRSVGGDVNDALLIYEALVALDARIITRCYGYTASAATIIAQAASEGCRQIGATALYLIHCSSCAVEGNSLELGEHIELLHKTDERLASLYAARSGGEYDEFVSLMKENGGRGRWLSPAEALSYGLVDEVLGADETTSQIGIVDRVKSWFSIQPSLPSMPSIEDINILHLPDNILAATSSIAFEEGQREVKASAVSATEDPPLDEVTISRNSKAYAEDAKILMSLR